MTRQTVAHVPIEQLLEHPDNVRDSLGELGEMAESIRVHGILQPLTATEGPNGKLLLLAGHRRLRAATIAGLSVVPVIIRHEVTDLVDHVVLMLVENTQRRDLNPVERAQAYARLRDSGLNSSEIARRVGTKPSTISYYLNLLLLSDSEREDVLSGELASTKAIQLARSRRATERAAQGRAERGRPRKVLWFGPEHRLAATVKRCTHDAVRVGGVGCGYCWEQAIRDEVSAAVEPSRAEPSRAEPSRAEPASSTRPLSSAHSTGIGAST